MVEAPSGESRGVHTNCLACGSSDAGYLFADGGFYCYKCQSSDGAPVTPELPTPKGRKKKAKATFVPIEVEYRDLPKRCLRKDTCEKWRYGVGKNKYGKTVQVAQYFDANGRLVGQKTRSPDKDFSILGDTKPAGLYGQSLWGSAGKMVVVTEGEIDALSVSQIQGNKWPVVSLPNGAQSGKTAVAESVEWLERFERVVFLLDNDEEGKKAALECAEVLSPGKARIATLPLKDANEMLVAGRGKEVISAIWEAKEYRPDEIVLGSDLLETMLAYDLSEGVPWPHSGLNAKTMGMHSDLGEVIAIVAATGAGKSTFCKEVVAHLTKYTKAGVISLEEPIERASLGVASVFLDKPLHLLKNAAIRASGLEKVWNEVGKKIVFYDHFGSVAPDKLMSKIRYMAKAQGVTHVVLDHLSIVASGLDMDDDERRALDSTMTTIATMAQEMKVCIIVVVHLKRTEGKSHENGKRISLSDIRGSHGIAQLAHTIIALERDQQSEDENDVTDLRVLKCRLTGRLGEAGQMKYDAETGRFKEITGEFTPGNGSEVFRDEGEEEAL